MMVRNHLQPGWPAGAASMVLSCGLALGIVTTGTALSSLVIRLAVLAAAFAVFGVMAGSEWLLAVATAPMLGAAFASADPDGGPAWGRSVLIGCLWFVAAEFGWYAIQRRGHGAVPVEVTVQRVREVATVAALTLAVGVVAAGAAVAAPTRSLLVKVALVTILVGGLAAALRQLAGPNTADPD